MHYSSQDFLLFVEQAASTPPGFAPETLETAKTQLQTLAEQKETALANAPDGALTVGAPQGRSVAPEYYLRLDGKRVYLRRNQAELARKLAQKSYDEAQHREAIRLLSLLEHLTQKDLLFRDAYDALRPERRALVVPDFLSDEEVRERWADIQYESMGFSPNYPEYYTSDGVRVRSVAERRIGTTLSERGILYLYEFPLKLIDGGIVYPDFTCFNLRTRKLYLWEHLGRLDEGRYVENNLRKLERYRASGYHLGVNLLVSHETDGHPLTQQEIDLLVENNLV